MFSYSEFEKYKNTEDGWNDLIGSVEAIIKELDEKEIPLTVIGICDELGIERQTLHNYRKRGEQWEAIYQYIRTKCERTMLEGGLTGGLDRVVTIFNLKCNYGYKDTQHIEQTIKGSNVDKMISSIAELQEDADK